MTRLVGKFANGTQALAAGVDTLCREGLLNSEGNANATAEDAESAETDAEKRVQKYNL